MEKYYCPTCHRPMNVYTITLTRSNVGALLKIARAYSPGSNFNFKKLRDNNTISSSDYTNMSHLKYLGLVEKVDHDTRLWRITDKGAAMITGQPVAKWVTVFNNKVLEITKETITMSEAIGYYDPPIAWASRAEALKRSKEMQFEII
jgi:hypothetical protein